MSELFKPLYCDTDSVVDDKTLTVILARRNGKAMLNAIYGSQASKYWQPTIPQENKNMNRDYIVVHFADHKTGIIFKDKIDGVFNEMAGDVEETRIMINGQNTFVMDKYADIVTQLLK